MKNRKTVVLIYKNWGISYKMPFKFDSMMSLSRKEVEVGEISKNLGEDSKKQKNLFLQTLVLLQTPKMIGNLVKCASNAYKPGMDLCVILISPI